ncbi:PEP-CTERM/exosortase system-associated acyltransferase [Thiocapsa rosea]|uniref:N-acyl amino acid synthase of PEP-CTERM/exosortase system n=1 Tax=Thiocapsa rosea TaxID=69360 RepID=A0A495V4C8_9GAMM|nr:PEP-CTERM/exosortase system-associated acyltransferase [Thiocapsa rosea]RKT43425.1 N-acyl amino acid synthase of PEP-CTERM/exosortase system [Thiocapsa rosea]
MSLNASESACHPGAGHGQDPYFRFNCVEDASSLDTVYRIRYQVYCVERGFLDENDFPDEAERDEFDAYSIHMLATHRAGHPAGTARLVMPSPLGFPLMSHCVFTGDYAFLNDPSHPALAGFAEISRLAVSKNFRRREGDSVFGGPPRIDPGRPESADILPFCPPRNTPEILIGLSRLLYQESKRRGVTHWMLAMERGLYLMLRRLGFRYIPAGPDVDYFGPVRPYVTSVEAFETALYATFPATLQYLACGLESEYLPDCIESAVAGDPQVQEQARSA